MPKILVSPHNDDAVLWASFTLCGNTDMQVITVFDSFIQPKRLPQYATELSAGARRIEDRLALAMLGLSKPPRFAGLRDDFGFAWFDKKADQYDAKDIIAAVDIAAGKPDWTQVELWIPAYEEDGHEHHNAVCEAFAATAKAGTKTHNYLTYGRSKGKSLPQHHAGATEVVPDPRWVARKLKALSCYDSQITIGELGCWPHFLGSQREYVL